MKKLKMLYIFLIIIITNSTIIKGQLQLNKYVFSNGGKTVSSEENTLSLTVGQSIIGRSNNNLYSGEIGFWYQYEVILVNLDEEDNRIPIEYELFQNYPNPFNPHTTIEYSIPKECYVSLIVYDILGREVVKLVNEKQKEGTYKILFNGNKLASGFYVYRIKAGKYIETKKMVYLK